MKRNYLILFGALITTGTILLLSSCKSIPKGAIAVKPFNTNKYLGKWFEIARFDFSFERNLKNTTAEYSLNDNGSLKVVNRGYNYKKKKPVEAIGKAKFVGAHNEAKLKVSFFGPFYAGYNVIAIDQNYQYALVAGKDLNYLWILSREKSIPDNIKKEYLQKASEIGFNISNLIWVEQD